MTDRFELEKDALSYLRPRGDFEFLFELLCSVWRCTLDFGVTPWLAFTFECLSFFVICWQGLKAEFNFTC